ncbi:hypothetical protein [Actinokineospora globicatena]|uniref:Uncharacterized protein n=1 Tax=Actinokineospora globicatena TaxID=103729 RepID=A0A9W6QR67_9PSEU|nr:hypothetical protein [Actinokineospora globicatena]GLW93164.1 hypothetical protein Aglo03_39800 [Actinokineospora globicatena]
MATRLLLEGPDLEALLDRVRTEHGADARIVSADRLRKGGVAGFFSKQWFEIGVEVPEPGDPTVPREQVLSVADLMELADKEDVAAVGAPADELVDRVPEQRVGVAEEEPTGSAGDPFARFFAEAGGPPVRANGADAGISAAQARAAGPAPRGQSAGEWAKAVRPRVGEMPSRPLDTAAKRPAERTAAQKEADAMLRAAVLGEQLADRSEVDEMTDEQLRAVLLGAQTAPPRPSGVRPAEFPSVQRPTGRVFAAQPVIDDEPEVEPVTPAAAVAAVTVDETETETADVPYADLSTAVTEEQAVTEERADFHDLLVPPRMPSSTARHALPDEDEDYLDTSSAEPISAEPFAADPAWPTADEPRLVTDPSPRPRRRWDTPVPTDLLVALPGKVIVVAGALQEATAAAEWICQKMRLGPGAVQVAGPDQIGRGRVLGPEHAAELAYDLKRNPVPSVVAIAAAVEDPDGGRWAGAVAKALGARHIVAAVDATRKTADLRRHLADLGGVDALAVHGAAASADPDSVRELGLPILTIDGVAPTAPGHRRT